MTAPTPPGVNSFAQTPLTPLVRKWWVVAGFGAAMAIIGIVLLSRLSDAKSVLVWLVAIGLVVSGLNEFVQAQRLTRPWAGYVLGVIYILTGIWAVAWPGITLWVLAVVTGIGLLAGGLSEVAFTLTYRREIPLWGIWVIDGLLSIIVGVFALVWPRATVVVLAILLGLRILLGGLAMVLFGFGMRRLSKTLDAVNA